MSKDRLELVGGRDGYRIYWLLAEEDEYGAALGPWQGAAADNDDAAEHEAACKAAARHLNCDFDRTVAGEYVFDGQRNAKLALRAARQAIRELHDGKPWPSWARQAVVNGWKPPKGWEP